MVQYCCCFGCNEKYVKGGGVTFHSFPKDEARKKVWVQKLRRENFTPTKFSKVCSKHFEENCFDREKFGGVWLKADAVPTIFNFPKRLINQTTRRKSPVKRITDVTTHTHSKASSSVPCADESHSERSVNDESTSSTEKISASTKRPLRYIGDFVDEDMDSPLKARQVLKIARKQICQQKKKIVHLRSQNMKFRRKISSLENLLTEIKEKAQMSDDALHVLRDDSPRSQ
ncbi:uncharacterized protein GBIM_18179 [Gryllus bimaculatus]|nr:uncharacterized protein GBIM_18179 [Gryllus bimaculatus]